jgi:hypothetical protein
VRAGPDGDVPGAVRVLQTGLERGAQPEGLLQHYLRTLQSRVPGTTTAVGNL